MDPERFAVTAEVAWIRVRGWLRVGLRLLGLGLVVLVCFNLVGPLFSTHAAYAPYRDPLVSALSLEASAAFVADVLVLGLGLVVAWWG